LSGVRVAAAQFAVGADVAANLAACLRLIEAAAARGAELVVLPAYVNHPEWYDDRGHAERVACRLDDEFLAALADAATRHQLYVKSHVTLASGQRISATNLLFDPAGELIAQGETQVLSEQARQWLDPGEFLAPVADTPIGRLGMYSCDDGAFAELSRHLSLSGAQILLGSLASITTDDTRLHAPARAAENKVWVIAANTIGPRPGAAPVPVPPQWLVAAGDSRIIRPDGGVAGQAPPGSGETLVVSTIVPGWSDDKTRPDGGDLFLARRPRLYGPVTVRPTRPIPAAGAGDAAAGADPDEPTTVAVVRPRSFGMAAIDEAARLVRDAAERGAELIVLPELFFYPNGRADGSFVDGIAVDMLSQALDGTPAHVVTSVPDDSAHVGILIGARGVRGRQLQLHACARHIAWQATLGDRLLPFDLDWGRLVIAVGDDALYPETFRLAALLDADAVAVPCAPAESWELGIGLPERVAEHRLNIVAAAHPGPGGGGAILVPSRDPKLHAERVEGFSGSLNQPDVTLVAANARFVAGQIHPQRSRTRERPAEGTYLVDGHPWRLAGVYGPPERR
jgi:predicted amidohydrolase